MPEFKTLRIDQDQTNIGIAQRQPTIPQGDEARAFIREMEGKSPSES